MSERTKRRQCIPASAIEIQSINFETRRPFVVVVRVTSRLPYSLALTILIVLLFVFVLCATDNFDSKAYGDCVFQSAFEKIPLLRCAQCQRIYFKPNNGQMLGNIISLSLQILLSVKFQPEEAKRRSAGPVRGKSSEL